MSKRVSHIEINKNILTSFTNTEIKKLTPYIDENNIKLTTRSRNFCYYYVMNGLNGLEAARMAKYSSKGIHVMANRLLKSVNNKKAIKLIMDNEIRDDVNKLEYNIFKILMTAIDYDILDYVNEDGTVKKELSSIPPALRKIISKIETKWYGKDANRKVITLEFMGKEYALNNLMKYINMIKETNDDKNAISDDVLKDMIDRLHGKGQ